MTGPARPGWSRGAALTLALALGCSGKPDVPILTWHAIGSAVSDDGWTVTEERFLAQLDALAAAGFRTVLPGSPGAPRTVALTFDDGTEDHLTRVLPALRARGMTATFFLVSGRLRRTEAERLVLGGQRFLLWSEARALLDAGMTIGSHGRTHARLPELDDDEARAELTRSRLELASGLGAEISLLAYPYNSMRTRHRLFAREAGYRAAVAGVVHGGSHPFALRRIPVKQDTGPGQLVRLVE